ncbi:hypothetical protein CGZ80_03465 [Rhodopirellula sp. MGV]|nr:hypothetical protein CGZ80_03465 [Rhodopirellula sp. MGV]PNY35227.1 hypothetical protein C2E31_19265 [Rhodopirellula baltica]
MAIFRSSLRECSVYGSLGIVSVQTTLRDIKCLRTHVLGGHVTVVGADLLGSIGSIRSTNH